MTETAARIPLATYRLQFNGRFRFSDATRIIAYLHDLGITDIYASPYGKARQGSLHGYDIVDPQALNPEIGTEEEYAAMAAELHRRGMGQVLDIVPNHMCVDSPQNRWWWDVLENGPSSPYAEFFDIDWEPVKKELKDKVLIPVLGDQYGNVLDSRELRLLFRDGAFLVSYYDREFPVRPRTALAVLEFRLEELQERLGADDADLAEYLSILTALRHLPPYTETDPLQAEERNREKEVVKRRLAALAGSSGAVRSHVEENVEQFNGTAGDPASFDLLDGLLDRQVYRLADWRVATEEINYRRFFDVNGLGAVRMERPAVFAAAHALLFRLVRDGSVTGLRVDHPDGLYNPVEYFHRLQRGCFTQLALRQGGPLEPEALAERVRELGRQYDEAALADPSFKPFYIVGEKILLRSERMPDDWPIFSTTGYVFLNSVNGLFIDAENSRAFDGIYEKFTRQRWNLPEILYEKKKLVTEVAMSSEVNRLGHALNDLSERDRHTRDFTLNSLIAAITEVIALFPVYRTYTNTWSVSDRDRLVVEHTVARAKRKNPAMSESIFDFLKDTLLLRFPREPGGDGGARLDFVMRFQQLTGPVMAKGVEDTAFYVYNRFVSLNEVGGAPERFGTPLETFHGQNIERAKSWPHALIATSTHDTKRSEDVRARLNVLSELPKEWSERVRAWRRMNRRKKGVVDGEEAPDRNEEYLLYQTLVGVWPVEPAEGTVLDVLVQRVRDYLIKAAREAKVNTSWISPNADYERAAASFLDRILRPSPANPFLSDFLAFQRMISHYGMFNSLSQTLLKICSPGVPDFYQGTELWDFSLVDPDNRRPVDFEKRVAALADLRERESAGPATGLARELSLAIDDGRIKLYTTSRALCFRRDHRELFEQGEYAPLAAEGGKAAHLCAFARKTGRAAAIIVVPRFLTRLIPGGGSVPFSKAVWGDTSLVLPGTAPGARYRNIFTGELLEARAAEGRTVLSLADVFTCFPVALLEQADADAERNGAS